MCITNFLLFQKITMNKYSIHFRWMIIIFPWISHRNGYHHGATNVLVKEDKKKEFHAKWWVTIARVSKIKRP